MKTTFTKVTTVILLLFVLFKITPAFSQVAGCRDPYANNYDPSATINDGSCTYDDTYYTPPELVSPVSDLLKENSGLQWAGNSLWSFNDRGGSPVLYRIDTASNAILQTVTLGGAINIDWEETAFDGTNFYVGDFGNNLNGARTDLKIYKFPFSTIPGDYTTNPAYTIPAEQIDIINFTYRDQPANPDSVALNTAKFDCEAMIIDEGKIHLFTKNWVDITSTHYVINSLDAGNYVAAPLETLNTGYLVSGADKAPGQNVIVLLGYQANGVRTHFMHILSDYSDGKYFNGNKRKITLRNASYMGQAEGITFRNDTYGYISSERIAEVSDQKLFSFNTSDFVPLNVLAEDLKHFSAIKINGTNKIEWNFSLNVPILEVQQSPDGLHFTVLKTYNNTTAGFLNDKPVNADNYYRLAWKQDEGEYKYSKVIRIKNKEIKLVSNLLLKSTGELSFTLSGNQTEDIAFKLLTTDGKTISEVMRHNYAPGHNKIKFYNSGNLNNIAIIAANSDKQKTTKVLHVME